MPRVDGKGWTFMVLMTALFSIVIVALWVNLFHFWREQEESSIQAWMDRETEGIYRVARSVEAWIKLRSNEQGIPLAQLEDEIHQNFFVPLRSLPGAHSWIYHDNHFLVDPPGDFPAEYQGMHLQEVFSLQKLKGASHTEAILKGVLDGGDGSDWYVWQTGGEKIYATWISIPLADGVWTIGSSTPRTAILTATKRYFTTGFEAAATVAATLFLIFLYIFGFRNWRTHQDKLLDVIQEADENTLKLVSSEENLRRYAFIVNATNDMMSLINRDYRYEAVNDAYCWNYGHPRERILGRHVSDIWGEKNFQDHIRQHIERCFAGEDVHYESWFSFLGSRETRYYEISMYPYTSDGNEISHIVTVTQDVTGEMLAERELQRTVYAILFLNRIIEKVSASLEPARILSSICEELADALDVPQVTFAVLEEDGLHLRITAEYYLEGCASVLDSLIPVDGNPKIAASIDNLLPVTLAEIASEEPLLFWQDLHAWRKTVSMLFVPLAMRGQAFGMLTLDSRVRREFSMDEIALVQSVASIASHALENARLYKALTLTNSQLTEALGSLAIRTRLNNQLHTMSDRLQSCLAIQEAYPIISKFAEEIFSGTSGAVFTTQEEENLLSKDLAWGEKELCADQIETQRCMALERSSENRQTALVSSCNRCAQSGSIQKDQPCLCLPLNALGHVLGVLYITDMPLPITEEWQHKMYSFAERISLSLGNLKLRHTLQTQSLQDPLTGLYNRRFLNEAMIHEVQRARRHKRSFGVMMIDIDHFKIVNDTYGHEAGDEVLRHLSRFLISHVRAEDIACRYGGEEFLIVLSETAIEESVTRAQDLLSGIRKLKVPYEGKTLTIRVSVGVACFPLHGDSAETVIQTADRALMVAKRSGRDRVIVAESIPLASAGLLSESGLTGQISPAPDRPEKPPSDLASAS